MQKKILTVSVAAYNVSKYLNQCLETITKNNVLERIEVLIVDDGSTDNTAIIANHYQNEYPNTFRVVKKKNGGWGSTVNTAIEMASGKYFKQLDGDDCFDSNTIDEFISELELLDDDIIFTPFLTFVSNTGHILDYNDPIKKAGCTENRTYNIRDLGNNFDVEMHQLTFKTIILKNNNIRLAEHAFYTDVELVVKALYYSHTVRMLPLTVYHYRVMREGQSCSDNGYKKHYRDHENVIYRIADFLHTMPESNGSFLGKKRLKDMIHYHYNLYCRLKPNFKHQVEFRNFDRKILGLYPEFGIKDSKLLRILRKSRFLFYIPLCLYYKNTTPF